MVASSFWENPILEHEPSPRRMHVARVESFVGEYGRTGGMVNRLEPRGIVDYVVGAPEAAPPDSKRA